MLWFLFFPAALVLSLFVVKKMKWPVWAVAPMVLAILVVGFLIKKLLWIIVGAGLIAAGIYVVSEVFGTRQRGQ